MDKFTEHMAQQDHYIAQTYLKHFADTDGRLHTYQKPNGKYFSAWPGDVCREWDDDLNPDIPDRPELLGDFRKMFEPHWNAVVEELKERRMAKDRKMVVSLCYAHMMICVPTWRRLLARFWEQTKAIELRFRNTTYKERGIKDEQLEKGIALIENGAIRLEAEPNSVKAWLTINLVKFACQAYHADWKIVENNGDIPFFTSDNPVAVQYGATPAEPTTKFMPITPKLGLLMITDPRKEHGRIIHKPHEEIERLLKEEPSGSIQSVVPLPQTVKNLNRLVAKCAESLVFSSRKEDGGARLFKKYGKYRIESDFPVQRQPDGSLIAGIIMRVRPRTD